MAFWSLSTWVVGQVSCFAVSWLLFLMHLLVMRVMCSMTNGDDNAFEQTQCCGRHQWSGEAVMGSVPMASSRALNNVPGFF
jgi:hypothetical protein